MTRYSIAFRIKGIHYEFMPNKAFWALLFSGFLLVVGFTAHLGWSHIEMKRQLAMLDEVLEVVSQQGSQGVGGDFFAYNEVIYDVVEAHLGGIPLEDEAEVSMYQFAPQILVALTLLVNTILRKLISYFIKLNNVMLLTQSKFDDMQRKPVALQIGQHTMQFTPSKTFWRVVLLAFLIPVGMMGYFYYSNQQMQERITLLELGSKELDELFDSKSYKDDVMGFFIDYFKEYEENRKNIQQNYRDAFLIQKQFVISKYLIREKVSRPEQLSGEALLEMNAQIGVLFNELILNKIDIEPHVHEYFAKTEDLNKVETALMEQAKFHVPASIKLAQSALETGYGKRVVNNNYFGIKDKTQATKYIETTEYYTAKEVALNKSKIISKTKVNKDGKVLYKCRVRDSFMAYQSPWASFRAHSVYLANNKRYSPLFTKGKDYQAWADKIGSTKYGGVGYATSPIYGNLLKKIIKRYSLDLLDY